MRPELTQEVVDPNAGGAAIAFHTNQWQGQRDKGQWKDDLPRDVAHQFLLQVQARLTDSGWHIARDSTKILMLTHKVLAAEQGYKQLADVFKRNESFAKLEDEHLKFLVETIEPVCEGFLARRYGAMFSCLGEGPPQIRSTADKVAWQGFLTEMIHRRETGSVGDIIDHVHSTKFIRLPEKVERGERNLRKDVATLVEREVERAERLRALRAIPYSQVVSLAQFVQGHSVFATKHGVKGAEFENVIVVCGRGWSKYNFGQLLEWTRDGVPNEKIDAYVESRNLLYVACSRPKRRLAVLFTQKVSDAGLRTLESWFGSAAVHAL